MSAYRLLTSASIPPSSCLKPARVDEGLTIEGATGSQALKYSVDVLLSTTTAPHSPCLLCPTGTRHGLRGNLESLVAPCPRRYAPIVLSPLPRGDQCGVASAVTRTPPR